MDFRVTAARRRALGEIIVFGNLRQRQLGMKEVRQALAHA